MSDISGTTRPIVKKLIFLMHLVTLIPTIKKFLKYFLQGKFFPSRKFPTIFENISAYAHRRMLKFWLWGFFPMTKMMHWKFFRNSEILNNLGIKSDIYNMNFGLLNWDLNWLLRIRVTYPGKFAGIFHGADYRGLGWEGVGHWNNDSDMATWTKRV